MNKFSFFALGYLCALFLARESYYIDRKTLQTYSCFRLFPYRTSFREVGPLHANVPLDNGLPQGTKDLVASDGLLPPLFQGCTSGSIGRLYLNWRDVYATCFPTEGICETCRYIANKEFFALCQEHDIEEAFKLLGWMRLTMENTNLKNERCALCGEIIAAETEKFEKEWLRKFNEREDASTVKTLPAPTESSPAPISSASPP